MRFAVVAAVLVLSLAPSARATPQTATLASVAADTLAGRLPATPADAPEAISIEADLATALRAEPLPGGREKTLYISLDDGVLTLRRSIAGARYRASGVCTDCDFRQALRGHTHPYENPFSVIDLEIAAREKRASLMVTRNGQIWLALPTRAIPKSGPDPRATLRYAVFGNRLECPARTPPDGWAASSVMGRRVEIVARATAREFGLALYVANPGEGFRRVEGMAADGIPSRGAVIRAADLNPFEMTLARLLHAAGRPATPLPGPTEAYTALDDFLAGRAGIDSTGGLETLVNGASQSWFSPLPTTVYLDDFSDLSLSELRFVSVQNSADCARILVAQGSQSFDPDAVRYGHGWSRERISTAPLLEGWTTMSAEEMPTGQVVPW